MYSWYSSSNKRMFSLTVNLNFRCYGSPRLRSVLQGGDRMPSLPGRVVRKWAAPALLQMPGRRRTAESQSNHRTGCCGGYLPSTDWNWIRPHKPELQWDSTRVGHDIVFHIANFQHHLIFFLPFPLQNGLKRGARKWIAPISALENAGSYVIVANKD